MDTEARNLEKFAKNLSKLRYTAAPCLTFEIVFHTRNDQKIITNTKSEEELLQWIRKVPANAAGLSPTHYLRLIVGLRVSDTPRVALDYVPFSSQAVFEDIVKTFHLPTTLLQVIFRRKSHFSLVIPRTDSGEQWKGSLMRLAADSLGHLDLVLAIATNESMGLTNALLLGCTKGIPPVAFLEPHDYPVTLNDMKAIRTFLEFSKPSAAHPGLLLAMLADLQIKRFILRDSGIRGKVVEALVLARLNRRKGPGVITSPGPVTTSAEEDIEYGDITRDVLHLFEESGHLSRAMVQFKRYLGKITLSLSAVEQNSSEERKKYLREHGKIIQEQLEGIEETIDNLIDSSGFTAEHISLVISSVWNLIAQQESRASQAIAKESKRIAEQATSLSHESKNIALSSVALAEDSKRIAAAAKRDSTSMKAIAALTMVFLPFTFIATLFAMPIFNWQADEGSPVLSPRSHHHFRMYWAAATPLTVVVLLAWIAWIVWSMWKQQREDKLLEQLRKKRAKTALAL